MPKKISKAKRRGRKRAKRKNREIQLNFISSETLASKSPEEKLQLILGKVKENIIVVLEEALDPRVEADLIQTTMAEIDSKDFFGIEFYRMGHQRQGVIGRLVKFFSDRGIEGVERYLPKSRMGLTIVGPTRMVEAIKKESDQVTMLAKVGE
ncbi:MAG: DUF2073 domain-containing protein [Candidatus Hydrothermarchaeales archaeon]